MVAQQWWRNRNGQWLLCHHDSCTTTSRCCSFDGQPRPICSTTRPSQGLWQARYVHTSRYLGRAFGIATSSSTPGPLLCHRGTAATGGYRHAMWWYRQEPRSQSQSRQPRFHCCSSQLVKFSSSSSSPTAAGPSVRSYICTRVAVGDIAKS